MEQSLSNMPETDGEERTHADDSVPVREIRVEGIAVEITQRLRYKGIRYCIFGLCLRNPA